MFWKVLFGLVGVAIVGIIVLAVMVEHDTHVKTAECHERGGVALITVDRQYVCAKVEVIP
jgi:hypothetical protein